MSVQNFTCHPSPVTLREGMAHSYTPGLTVSDDVVLHKRRLLPIAGEVVSTVGDRVTPQTVVARAQLPGKVHALNVANSMGVAPDEITEYLTKREGDPIEKDEVVAANKPLLSWFKTEVRAPVRGTIDSVSTVTGQLLLREPPEPLEVPAYVQGTVTEVIPEQGVTIEARGVLIQGIFGIGGEVWGELALAVESPEASCTADRLRPDLRGKIVVCGSFLDSGTMQKARELGIAALVVGGLHDQDLRALLGYDLGVAITGTERVGLTLLLTEGFGRIPMAAKTFTLLARYAGRQVSVSGATQIRAGVIRPEIIIPHDGREAAPQARPADRQRSHRAGIRIGDTARIVRDPYFGRIGRVTGLPADLRRIETESRVRVLEVELSDGSTMTVPRPNVEIIEEV